MTPKRTAISKAGRVHREERATPHQHELGLLKDSPGEQGREAHEVDVMEFEIIRKRPSGSIQIIISQIYYNY